MEEKVIAVCVFLLWLSFEVWVRNYLYILFRVKHASSYTWKYKFPLVDFAKNSQGVGGGKYLYSNFIEKGQGMIFQG